MISLVIIVVSFFIKHIISTLLLVLLAALAILAIYLDVSWLNNGIKENSVTEISQEVILAMIVGLYLWQAKNPSRRSAMTLIAAFFLCMLI
ncbi:MAG TPA: hypothetical protein VJS14_00905, partial [Enterobacteriaceae bacterium]|nr:hypothetical protein [Enterobacteriaceae bacterium]